MSVAPKSRSRGRPALPMGLLGMLVLVGAIERDVFRGNLAFILGHAESWSHAARALKRAAPGCDVLCFGDSLTKCGVVPRVFREKTGRRAFNLAAVGGSSPSSYFLLRRALDAGARPSTVIVNFNWEFLALGPANAKKPYPWADLLDLRESVALCTRARDPALFARITLARAFVSVKNRNEIRAYTRSVLKGEHPDPGSIARLLYRNWNVNEGAMIGQKASFPDPLPPPGSVRQPSRWRPDPTNRYYLHRFLDLAARHGIRVVWLLPPVCPGAQAQWDLMGHERPYEAFARAQLRRHPNLAIVDGRRSGYDASVFLDTVHLDRDGARGLTDAVAGMLQAGTIDFRAPTRWYVLPAYRRPAREVPVEDLVESLAVIQRRPGQGREMRR